MEISAKVRRDQRRRVVDPRPLLLKSCNTAAKNVIINKAAFASMYANHDEPNSLSHVEGILEVEPFQKSISRFKNADCLLQKKSNQIIVYCLLKTFSSHKSVIPLSTRILTRRFILVEDSTANVEFKMNLNFEFLAFTLTSLNTQHGKRDNEGRERWLRGNVADCEASR